MDTDRLAKTAKKWTAILALFVTSIIALGYALSGLKIVGHAADRAGEIWELPEAIPPMRRDIKEIKIILNGEFGEVDENGRYRPRRRGRRGN